MTDTNKIICKIVVDNNRARDKDNPVRAIITNITHQLLMITRNTNKFIVMLSQISLLKQNIENKLAHWNMNKVYY